MANVLTPFGFRHIGFLGGYQPNYPMRRRKIALGNTNPIFKGDPIVSLSTGYIAQAAVNTPAVGPPTCTGIFQGCEYYSVSQQRKVRSPYWPGSDAQFDPDAFVIDQSDALFLAQSNGSPIVIGNVDNNIGFFIATGGAVAPVAGSGQGNTISGISGALLDVAATNGSGSGAISASPGLSFRIIKLFSDDMVQGAPTIGSTAFNGADNTTNFNFAVVMFNQISMHAGVFGI
jgi:hypothetical protein